MEEQIKELNERIDERTRSNGQFQNAYSALMTEIGKAVADDNFDRQLELDGNLEVLDKVMWSRVIDD